MWQFSIAADAMAAPTLASPNNGATSQPVTPTLSWNSVTGATRYHLQVSIVDSFATTVVNDTALAQTSQQVGPFAKNTTYYWHVRAKNSQNTSPWSNIWNFTTEQPQAGPGLINPPNSASDQPTTLTLSWSDMAGALSYQLQVSTSSTFGTTIFDDARISGTSQLVGPLSNATTYYWRVRANYLLFSSDWSNIWSFMTVHATPPPAPQLVSPANGLANQPTAVTFGWSSAPGATIYHLQVATVSSFSTLVVNDSTLSTTSSQVSSLTNNTIYYWRVRARNSYGWSPNSAVWSFTTTSPTSSTLSLHATIDFPAYGNASEFKPTDYKIIGLPGNSDLDLSAFLSGAAESDWIAFWDNGAPTDYLVHYNPSSTFKFAAGRSFWLIHKGPWSINASVPAASLNAAQQVEIPLHQGWNLITNPFTASIAWSTIQSLNGVSEQIQTFNGSFNVSASLDPYVGYYFFNATNLSVMKIPYSNAQSASQVASPIQQQDDPADWRVQVSLSSPQGTDKFLSFGVSTTADEGQDAHDFHKARGVSSIPSSYFNKPEWDAQYSSFAADVRPLVKEFERWDITITAPQWRSGEPIDMAFDGIDLIPSEFDVYLIDNLHTISINLREYPMYRFTPVTVNSILSVLVGKSQALREFVHSMAVPREYTLGANYPNPFNPSTTIPVELPVASEITLKIFSMLGQEIKTLHSGNLRAGKHWFRWDGTNETGQAVPSGTYFYRLSSSRIMQTKKMILLK
ncbi:MAG: T9SS type A sorting domain-containing protein [Ignavibacteriales bacterium]|nr:T9SS type A sorting domain-containing protein [Ignavibacteriales bacterium]